MLLGTVSASVGINRQAHPENDLVVFTAVGPITAREIHQAAMPYVAGPETPPRRVLLDFTQSSLDGISIADLKGITLLAFGPGSLLREQEDARVAFVAADDLGYGLMRTYQAYVEHEAHKLAIQRNYGVFRSLDDALKWIVG